MNQTLENVKNRFNENSDKTSDFIRKINSTVKMAKTDPNFNPPHPTIESLSNCVIDHTATSEFKNYSNLRALV